MLRILADYHDLTVSLDNLALLANSFDGRFNFHFLIPILSKIR